MNHVATVGSTMKEIVESVTTSGLPPEEVLQHLDSYGVDWYLTEQGDLMIKYWQVGAEGLVSPEQVATIKAGRAVPNEAKALEWVSRHLAELRQQYAGRWGAVVGSTVAASAPTLPELLQQVAESGVEKPFITEIPTGQITWITTYDARSLV